MGNYEERGGVKYFDRFGHLAAGEGTEDSKGWDSILFRSGLVCQAAELNEIQSVGAYYLKNLGLAIFNEGDIVSGLSIWQQKSDGTNFMHVLAGKVFIDGKVRHISQQNNIKLDATGTEYLGLKLDVKYLTENDDSSYRDPAEGFDNYNQAGAHRRRFDYTWKVWRPGTDTTYVQVFELYNGYQRNLTQGSPAFSKIYDALARRTFDESGDYMLRPFQVSVKNNPNDSSTMYVITGKGKAYVRGHEIDMGTSQQTLFEKARDLRGVTGDAITYRKDTAVYELTDDYVASISSVTANVLVVEAVTRGAAAGGTDALTNTPVQDILQVCASYGELDATRQLLETTVTPYTESTDWNQTGNTVDWSPGGAEPAGASTYYVLYTYQTTLTPAVRTKTRINALAVTRSGSLTYDRLSDPTGAGLKTVSGQDGISVAMITDTAAGVSATWIQGYDYYVATGRNNDELVRNNIYDADRYSSASGSDGAQDWEKEIGSIVIDWGTGSSSQPAAGASFFVTYDYWAHGTEGDYVHAGSYDSYSDIDRIAGIYSGANFTDQYMRDTIDFRSIEGKYPYGYTNKGSGGTKKQIRANTSVTINYTHYLRRIDCLYMDPRGYVKIKKGDPGINPGMVNVPGDSMGIAFLDILPYTYDTNDVNVRTIQNKRYTMKDIAKIEDRVKRLEYFNVSQMLESDAFSKFTVGEKRGVFVDTFIGTAHSDINFGDGTIIYDVCVDPTSETLRLGYNMGQTDLTISAFGGDTAQWNNALTLPVTEKLLFENPYATGWDSVQPFEVFDKHGELELYPEQDYWIDTGTPPQMDVDITGDLQHRTETLDNSLEWGAWRTVATGWNINWRRTQPWPSNVLNQERWGQREGHVPGQNFIDLGDRVVDVSWIPFCREKTIEVQAMAMRVSTGQLRVTFGGDVMAVSAASATYVADSLHAGDPSWYIDTNNTVKTDANGFTAFQFTIPGGTYPVGAHSVRVDNPTAGKQSRTYAGHEFEARGMYQQKEHVHVPRERTPKKPAPPPKPPWNPPLPWPEEPNGGGDGGEGDGDPLAQTFRIPPGLPCILSSMDLYFKEKDANEPVQIQLRTTLNGYPTTDILTYSNLNPDNVNVSEDASVATNFPFEDPVTLEANVEYAIVVYSGSPNYNLFYSELGETDLTTGNQVSKNPFSGVYFRAANTSTWQADGFKDMKFKIYRCHFDSPAMLTFANVTGLQTGWTAPAITAVEPKSTRLVYEYSTDGGSTWKTCIANDDIDHSTVATQFQLRVQFITDNSYLSPIVHKDKIGIINVLSLTDGDYFSKEIELDTTAQFLDLYLDQYEPANTDLTVYYTSDEGSQSGNWSSTWKACTLHVSDGRTGIRELENDSYNTKGTTIWKEHEYHNALGAVGRSFRLRINMKTTNRAITPKAKRLRCVFY